jgi:hypothetical protein
MISQRHSRRRLPRCFTLSIAGAAASTVKQLAQAAAHLPHARAAHGLHVPTVLEQRAQQRRPSLLERRPLPTVDHLPVIVVIVVAVVVVVVGRSSSIGRRSGGGVLATSTTHHAAAKPTCRACRCMSIPAKGRSCDASCHSSMPKE